MTPPRQPADLAGVPFPTADGRFAVELRFRLDPQAPAQRVAMLQAMLHLRPAATTTLFAIDRQGVRALRIEGPELGDVYGFATRVADAIREIGDVLYDQPGVGGGAAELRAEAPAERRAGAAHGVETVSNEESPPRWAYEPPDAFLAPEPEASGAAAVAQASLRALRRLWPRRR